jgi:YHS domain-containing protein
MKTLFLILAASFLPMTILAQVDPIDANGIAIGGYDVVSYQAAGKAEKGNAQFTSTFGEAKYLFTSKENQKLFESQPSKYLPQYDGYCALAVSYGKKISVDPETFKVANGKLYLFFHGKSGGRTVNSLDTWNKNEDRLLKKANDLWPDVKKKKYKPSDKLD